MKNRKVQIERCKHLFLVIENTVCTFNYLNHCSLIKVHSTVVVEMSENHVWSERERDRERGTERQTERGRECTVDKFNKGTETARKDVVACQPACHTAS